MDMRVHGVAVRGRMRGVEARSLAAFDPLSRSSARLLPPPLPLLPPIPPSPAPRTPIWMRMAIWICPRR